LGHKTDADTIRQFNRILLAKLKIEIDGIPVKKEIALFTPAMVNNIDTKKFTLWGQDGKEYILSQKDHAPFYFDIRKFCTIPNSKEQIQLTSPPKIVPIQNPSGYMQEISYNNEKGTCKIKSLDQKTLMLELNFFSCSLEKILNEQEELNQQISKEIRSYNELEKRKKDAERFLLNTRIEKEKTERTREYLIRNTPAKPELVIFTEQKTGELNLTDKELKEKIKEAEKELHNYDQNINAAENKIKKLQTEKQKLENKIDEHKMWNYIRLEEFSLYLLKPGTAAAEIDNKENKLLLLDVKP
jgi:molecular chaperone DnaK (HSP70)